MKKLLFEICLLVQFFFYTCGGIRTREIFVEERGFTSVTFREPVLTEGGWIVPEKNGFVELIKEGRMGRLITGKSFTFSHIIGVEKWKVPLFKIVDGKDVPVTEIVQKKQVSGEIELVEKAKEVELVKKLSYTHRTLESEISDSGSTSLQNRVTSIGARKDIPMLFANITKEGRLACINGLSHLYAVYHFREGEDEGEHKREMTLKSVCTRKAESKTKMEFGDNIIIISKKREGDLKAFLSEKKDNWDDLAVEKDELFYFLKYDKSGIPKDGLKKHSGENSAKGLNEKDTFTMKLGGEIIKCIPKNSKRVSIKSGSKNNENTAEKSNSKNNENMTKNSTLNNKKTVAEKLDLESGKQPCNAPSSMKMATTKDMEYFITEHHFQNKDCLYPIAHISPNIQDFGKTNDQGRSEYFKKGDELEMTNNSNNHIPDSFNPDPNSIAVFQDTVIFKPNAVQTRKDINGCDFEAARFKGFIRSSLLGIKHCSQEKTEYLAIVDDTNVLSIITPSDQITTLILRKKNVTILQKGKSHRLEKGDLIILTESLNKYKVIEGILELERNDDMRPSSIQEQWQPSKLSSGPLVITLFK